MSAGAERIHRRGAGRAGRGQQTGQVVKLVWLIESASTRSMDCTFAIGCG